MRELEQALRFLALRTPAPSGPIVEASPTEVSATLRTVAEMTDVDCEAIIYTVLLRDQDGSPPDPKSPAEWAAMVHLEAALVATLMHTHGVDPSWAACYLREQAGML